MSGDESVNNAQERAEEAVAAEAPPEDRDAESPVRPASEEEWVKEIRDKVEDVARAVAELLRGRQIASVSSVYIDARSGGVFFGGEARITGDVIGGERIHKTKFTGPVSGPVHTGSGDIYYDETRREGIAVGVERVLGKDLIKIHK